MNHINIGNKIFDFKKKTYIMGILNVTPDSFSDGGKFNSIKTALSHAKLMEKQGADIIDIGGESTRPFSKKITIKEEMDRVIPIVEELINEIQITYKSKIAKRTIEIGVSMVNDITALRGDKKMASIVSEKNIPICLMHMKGKPHNMQLNPNYNKRVIDEIHKFFQNRIEFSRSVGIKKKNTPLTIPISPKNRMNHEWRLAGAANIKRMPATNGNIERTRRSIPWNIFL